MRPPTYQSGRRKLYRLTLFLFPLIISMLAAAGPYAAAQPASPFDEGNRRVKVELVTDRVAFQPSDDERRTVGKVGIRMDVEPGWHIYWENSGEAGQATQVDFILPDGWQEGPVQYPTPQKFIERGDIITYGYDGSILLAEEISNPPVVPTEDQMLKVSATVSWLVCKDICVPGYKELSIEVPYNGERALQASPSGDLFRSTAEVVPRKSNKDLPISVSTALIAGDTPNIELHISGLPHIAAGELAQHIQVFPREASRVVFGAPKLKLADDYAQILIPVGQRMGAELDSILTSGIVTFGQELSGMPHPLTFDWEFKFSKSEVEKFPKSPGAADGIALTYREVRHGQPPPPADESGKSPQIPLLLALFSGLVAGLILNLMPCVLPVLSLKIMSLSLNKDLPFRERAAKSFAYFIGIESTFVVLAVLVASLRNVGLDVGWGFQFQHPGFVFLLALVVLIFALGFFDLYFVSLPGASKLDQRVGHSQKPLTKSFGEGVLVTLLSTPCTAPFLGTALAFAFAQSAAVSTIVFLSIGVGLALPYVLVALVPKFAAFIPRPGNWMVHIKELMGFLLLGTVIWLLFVLESLVPGSSILALGFFLWMTFLLWLRRPLSGLAFLRRHGRLQILLPLALMLISFFYAAPKILEERNAFEKITSSAGTVWTPYTPELASRLTAEGKYIFLDFTAQWCISCKFNERFVLNTPRVQRLLLDQQITPMRADWTDGSKMVTEALEQYGAHGVPLYVLLGPNGRSQVLPTILSESTVSDAIEKFVKR